MNFTDEIIGFAVWIQSEKKWEDKKTKTKRREFVSFDHSAKQTNIKPKKLMMMTWLFVFPLTFRKLTSECIISLRRNYY